MVMPLFTSTLMKKLFRLYWSDSQKCLGAILYSERSEL